MCNEPQAIGRTSTARSALLSFAVLLLAPASRSLPDLEALGTQEFKDQVAAALQQIRDSDSRCAQMLDELIMSSNKHFITESDAQGGWAAPLDKGDAFNGMGSGTIVSWNPEDTLRLRDDVLADPVTILKHELTHSHDADNGTWSDDVDGAGILVDEVEAIRAENRYRCASGGKQRMTYGVLLEGCLETKCTGSSCNLRFRSYYDPVECMIVYQVANLQETFNSCFAIDDIPFSANDLEDFDDGDDDHIAELKIKQVALEIEVSAVLCCGDDITGGADCTTCNEMQCSIQFHERILSKPTIYCTAKGGLVCGLPSISFVGLPSANATSGFTISAAPARGNRTGLVLYSCSGRANFPFQGGTLCVSPPLRRSSIVSSGGTSGGCDGVFSIDWNAFASGNTGGNPDPCIQSVGQQVNTQFWGRDSVATGSFLSDALEFSM